MTSNISRISLRTAIVSLSIHTVVAADGVWTNPAGGSWAEAANWASATIADGSGATADFSTLDLATNAAVTLDGARTIGTLRFADTAASNDWSLNTGSAGPLTLAAATTPTVSAGSGTTTIGAVVAGSQGFQKTGTGVLTLSGVNTFTGQLLVSQGTLKAGNAAALGAGGAGNETIVASGAAFDLNGQQLTNTEIYRITGTGPGGAGAFVNMGGGQQNGVNRVNLDANATVGGTGRWDLRAGNLPTLDLAGFTLTKVGTNQVSLVGRDLTTDPAEPADTVTAVLTAGNLVINEGIFAIENTATADASGSITINSPGIFGLWANKAGRVSRPIVSNNGNIQNLGSNAVIDSPVTIGGNTLTLSGGATTQMNGVVSGTGNLLKTGTGNFNFPNANTFTGKTVISGGILGLRGEAVLGNAPAAFQQDHLTFDGGGLSTLAAGTFYVNGGPVLSGNRGVTIAAGGANFDIYGHANARSRVAVSTPITGPGALRKTGGGYLTLEAANTYEGGTTVSDGPAVTDTTPYGAIQIANYGAFGPGSLTFSNSGAINGLRFLTSGTLNTPISLAPTAGATVGFIVDPGRVATLGGTVEGGTFEGAQVQVNGGGTLVIPDAKTYSSATRVTGGTLVVNGTLADSDASVAVNGAIGGSGTVRMLTLEEGSRIIASSPPLHSMLGVTANKAEGGKGVEVLATNSPATPGTRTVDVVDYGDDPENPVPEINNFSTAAYRSAVFQNDAANHKITLTYTNSTRTWGGADGTWDVATTPAWVEDDQKFFQGDAVTFGNPAAAATVTLAGTLAPSAITVDNTNNYLFNGTGTIAGGSLTKNGTGMLVLATGNNHAGGTTINGGILSLSASATAAGGSAGALGTGTVTVNAGGTLKLWVSTGATSYYDNALTLDGGRVLAEDGVNVINAPVTLGAAGGIASAKWSGKNLVFAKPVSGSGKLTAQREVPSGHTDASVILATSNTYTGGTDLFSGVLRVANSDQALGTGTVTFTGAATLATAQNGGARAVANPIAVGTGITATFDGGYAPLTLNGNISGPGIVAMGSSGVVALGGNNTYTGGTNVGSTGLLRLDSPGALGTTGVITFSGGTLQATAANTADYSARFSTTATGQGFRLNTNGQAVTWASPLTGATATLHKFGEGTLTVTGASTFGGGTNVQGGVLETAVIADAGATPLGTFSTAGGSYLSFGGGTLRYTGPTVTTARYFWSDQVSAGIEVTNVATTLTLSSTAGAVNKPFTKSGPGTLTIADTIDGAATVTVAGGRLNLNGNNTYTGLTTVSAGTLAMATASLPDGGDVRITTGATLDLGFTGEDAIDQLFIDGVEMAKGTWGGTASAATHKTPLITGNGILNVRTGPTGGGGGGYDAWATDSGLTSANNGKSMDPDGDGLNNLGEFAFDDVALSGKRSGKVVLKNATIDGKDYLTLTLPVRAGASFNEDMVSNAVDGVIYTIQGSENLSAFTLEVVEVTGTDATAIQADLPGLTSEDWTYRTFRPVADMSLAPKQFLRALANEPQ